MGWRTVIINTHSKLSYQNNHLIFKSVDSREMIHLSEIDSLLLETTNITITTMLMKRLIDENILVIFCDDKRLPIGKMMPFFGCHNSSLQLPKQINWSYEQKATIWTDIISQKIINQSYFLKHLAFYEKSDAILYLHDSLGLFDPTNREGHAARIYFNTLFGTKFTRESENDINAGLNYGYTLLMSLFAREISKNGCMTQIGLKHANQFNDFNLASDLMEPFRVLVDAIIYENRDEPFYVMKRCLFDLFNDTYHYDNKEMFLTNIVSDYTKKIVKALNGEREGVPMFRI
ncbi:type II CRISPR-associated endonuclease Cas1 [Vagococcus penaei]|uniref:CRISPR-associated endonuclease Cas1 n=1 Tax=Vagococcus penaei TaxID=633807 RepID=A0A1Q2D5N4_9ENTE|nr:type II CRISPR-associated endonuclease Cas1 [Vagococcus penaei]AQP53605.1 subtype II CRISPR-associated endonuclease Cas1 [Vagococcus penaei]RSU07549.1 type II CRISPR-associated endonuclease Cas1 [Vagococcus penaei]